MKVFVEYSVYSLKGFLADRSKHKFTKNIYCWSVGFLRHAAFSRLRICGKLSGLYFRLRKIEQRQLLLQLISVLNSYQRIPRFFL